MIVCWLPADQCSAETPGRSSEEKGQGNDDSCKIHCKDHLRSCQGCPHPLTSGTAKCMHANTLSRQIATGLVPPNATHSAGRRHQRPSDSCFLAFQKKKPAVLSSSFVRKRGLQRTASARTGHVWQRELRRLQRSSDRKAKADYYGSISLRIHSPRTPSI